MDADKSFNEIRKLADEIQVRGSIYLNRKPSFLDAIPFCRSIFSRAAAINAARCEFAARNLEKSWAEQKKSPFPTPFE